MKANGSTAVMAQRAPGLVEADDAQRALWRKLDFFPTPPWAARAGAELIKRLDPLAKSVWEPACGEGHIAQPFRQYFEDVIASDIYDHGFGAVMDFLAPNPPTGLRVHWIVTNPPFKTASEFITRGLQIASRGVAVLVRLSFLESADRYDLLYGGGHSLVVAPFSERVPMQLGSWDPDLSSASAYAWFIFAKPGTEAWMNTNMPRLCPIQPGTRDRLTKPDDARRFAKLAPAPLFDGGAT